MNSNSSESSRQFWLARKKRKKKIIETKPVLKRKAIIYTASELWWNRTAKFLHKLNARCARFFSFYIVV